MPKLLIQFSGPQAEWLRAEAKRLDLPGGVSELARRAVDDYREETEMRHAPSIPPEVLEKIVAHRPPLSALVTNLAEHPEQAAQLERSLAVAYLAGETRLSALETFRLGACANGEPYGGIAHVRNP